VNGRDLVLIVDDHALLARALVSLCTASGFDAHAVHSGPEALAFVRSHPAVGLILLDMNMPTMSGIEVMQALRKTGGECEHLPPVVMFSADDDPATRNEAIQRGAAGFVSKADPRGLLRVVAAHVRPASPPLPSSPSRK
jgi:CheY-like chemotaxis protein